MIKRETIEDFIKLMVEHDLVELDVADGDQSITLRRAEPGGGAVTYVHPAPAAGVLTGTGHAAAGHASSNPGGNLASIGGSAAPAAPAEEGAVVKSPMVGTFYSRSSPDAEPFVSIGSKVNDSTVVCLVEAMKVFNEIKAECKGEIVEVLVADGDPVEYGQPLFRVKPA